MGEGVMMLMAGCINCGRLVFCNPDKVPSLVVNGKREPLCRGCHAKWNKIHRPGLEPTPIQEGAYYD